IATVENKSPIIADSARSSIGTNRAVAKLQSARGNCRPTSVAGSSRYNGRATSDLAEDAASRYVTANGERVAAIESKFRGRRVQRDCSATQAASRPAVANLNRGIGVIH